ncbi:Protein CBG25673 [Caenorhabditis briggsae]|uniref:Uncharacterized protein n=2 Tax=Caenorhabditis briggsae TaxID=6238 RepID=A0AAE9A7D5_CAEBR|nr:Protein CBG25673 [Caenorhabditis briggsae]ULT92577.1 hypothetical protein L3Y34_009984 [Caenorhabditis briggsae]CAS00798.1 Protein CBG25673 [Caenorhabditis briggsae]
MVRARNSEYLEFSPNTPAPLPRPKHHPVKRESVPWTGDGELILAKPQTDPMSDASVRVPADSEKKAKGDH